jgi:hypothetical protein
MLDQNQDWLPYVASAQVGYPLFQNCCFFWEVVVFHADFQLLMLRSSSLFLLQNVKSFLGIAGVDLQVLQQVE